MTGGKREKVWIGRRRRRDKRSMSVRTEFECIEKAFGSFRKDWSVTGLFMMIGEKMEHFGVNY